jgi:hypothetical protein
LGAITGGAVSVRNSNSEQLRFDDVLEHGVQRCAGLVGRAVEVRRARLLVGPASLARIRIRRQAARTRRRSEPLHHSRGDRAVDGRGKHGGALHHPQCHAHQARASALRGEPAQPGRECGVGGVPHSRSDGYFGADGGTRRKT